MARWRPGWLRLRALDPHPRHLVRVQLQFDQQRAFQLRKRLFDRRPVRCRRNLKPGASKGLCRCCKGWPVKLRRGCIQTAVPQLNVLGAVGRIVTDDHYHGQIEPNGRVELGQPAHHEATVAGEVTDAPLRSRQGQTNGALQPQSDRPRVRSRQKSLRSFGLDPAPDFGHEPPAVGGQNAVLWQEGVQPFQSIDKGQPCIVLILTLRDGIFRQMLKIEFSSKARRLDLRLIQPVYEERGRARRIGDKRRISSEALA